MATDSLLPGKPKDPQMASFIWFNGHHCLDGFSTSTPEYETQEAHKEYTQYQLQECCFIYEDPDNEEQPGVFLSEYILHIFTAHLTAVAGKVRVDLLVEFGKPGYQTAEEEESELQGKHRWEDERSKS
jgi:hypothetical protein